MRYLHWFNVDRNIVLGLILSLPVLMGSTCNSTVVEGPTGPERLPDSLLYPSQANAVAFSESSEGTFWPQILLVAASQNELWYSQWWDVRPGKSRKGGWSEWFRMGNPTGVDPFNNWNKNMPLVPWKDENDHRRVNGFFQYIDNQVNSRLGAHWWDYPNSPPHRFDTHPSGTQPFSPLTGTAWNFFHTPRLNFFGVIATGNNRNSLMEYWWSGTDWRWTDHGRPTGNIERSRIGNQSVVITKGDRIQETFLFITGDDFGGLSVEIRLYLRYHHGEDKPNWAWKDLGKPDNTNRMLEPLVLSHLDQATGRTNINVFVSAFNTDLGRWQLYERFWNGSGDWDEWEDWKLWGEPPLLQEDYPDKTSPPPDTPWKLECGVVWFDETTKRMNLFGTRDSHNNPKGFREGGQVVQFYWDGADWNWGETIVTPERQSIGTPPKEVPVPFRVSSCVAVDQASRDKISVFGVSEGRQLWERTWDTAVGQRWEWHRHA